MVTVKAGALADLVRDIFAKAGCSAAEAERIGKYLVSANLTGHDSHGVVRVPRYVQWKKVGVVIADREVKIVTETPVLAVVDGLHGFGQTVAPQAVTIGIEKCRKNGLSMVALRNAGHIGRVGDWAEMGGGSGLRLGAFRQRVGQRAGGALRRHRASPLDRAVRGRRAAPRPDAHHSRFCHVHRRRRQGAGGEPGRQEAARQRADRSRRPDGHRPAPALRRLHRHRPPRPFQGQGRHPRLRRAQGLGACPDVRAARRLAHRHERHRRRPPLRQRHAVVLHRSQGGRSGSDVLRTTLRATSPTSRAPSRRRPAARC